MQLFQHWHLFFVTYLPWIFVVTRLAVQLVTLFNRYKKRTFRNKNEGAVFFMRGTKFNLICCFLRLMRFEWFVNALYMWNRVLASLKCMENRLCLLKWKKCVLTSPAKISTSCEMCGQWKQTSVRNEIYEKTHGKNGIIMDAIANVILNLIHYLFIFKEKFIWIGV